MVSIFFFLPSKRKQDWAFMWACLALNYAPLSSHPSLFVVTSLLKRSWKIDVFSQTVAQLEPPAFWSQQSLVANKKSVFGLFWADPTVKKIWVNCSWRQQFAINFHNFVFVYSGILDSSIIAITVNFVVSFRNEFEPVKPWKINRGLISAQTRNKKLDSTW